MSGFLGGLGLNEVEANPNAIAPGYYAAFLTKSEVISKQDGTQSWKMVYRIDDSDAKAGGKEADEWYNNLANLTPKAKSYLKRRVLQLGVPDSEVENISPESLIGTPVWIKVYKNARGYQAIAEVKLRNKNNTVDPSLDPDFNEGSGTYGVATSGAVGSTSPVATQSVPTARPVTGMGAL